MADANNKFEFRASFAGDKAVGTADSVDESEKGEFARDSAGVPNPNLGEQHNLDMALEPNKFPRQKGHDSLSGDEVIFS